MAHTSETIRAALTAAGWEVKGNDKIIEDFQRKSFWYSNTIKDLDVHLMLIEDLTPAENEPNLYIYTHDTGWREIKVEDLTA